MSSGDAAFLLVGVVHVLGAALLVGMLLRAGDTSNDLRRWWRGDDGPGPQGPHDAPAGPGGDALPLGRSVPASVRLRGPGRLADGRPRRRRGPAHAPDRQPVRAPDRG